MKDEIKLPPPKEVAVGLCLPRRAEERRGAANASCRMYCRESSRAISWPTKPLMGSSLTTWSWCQVEHLRKQGVLSAICERVRFARRRLGHYEVIDFLAVLFGYAISGERALEVFYEGLQPFAVPFMALFDRDWLPARSTLSRFLTALIVPIPS